MKLGAGKDLSGTILGRLTIIKEAEPYIRPGNGERQRQWLCQCSCGKILVMRQCNLMRKATRSCGCYTSEITTKRNTKHGKTNTSEFNIWNAMKDRCFNTNNHAYKYYGGRGITVCDRWKDSFENFLEDMGERPSKKHSIDRFPNNNGNYEPGNCRWATMIQQGRNKRDNRLNEEIAEQIRNANLKDRKSKKEIANKYGVGEHAIYDVLKGATWKKN